MWDRLINDFCARHALVVPEPDERGHLYLGFDNIEVSLFEDLGRLYLIARIVQAPGKTEDRERLIRKACAYLLPYLYIDECLLNLYNDGPDEYIILVSVMTEPDGMESFENSLAALVNRAEGLIAHLEESARPGVENRLAVFRP